MRYSKTPDTSCRSYRAALMVMAGGEAKAASERYGVALSTVYSRLHKERQRAHGIWPEDEVTL